MFAAVDLGSNSFRLHVGTWDGEGMRILKSARDQIRLGAGLDESGRLTEAAMQSALQSPQGFRAILAEFPLDAVQKSELLRVGVALLKRLDTAGIKDILAGLPSLKAGGPKKGK